MFRFLDRSLRQFRHDERGIVLILFTLMFVPILLIVAVAVDFSQTLVVKRQLIGAVDAAALTVAQLPDLTDEQAADKAEDFIKAHYPDSAIGNLKTFSVSRNNGTVDVSATAELDTSFLRVAGYDKLSVTVNSMATMKRTKLELAMVLDNTGSMGWMMGGEMKIDALKSAAGTLVDTLFGNVEQSEYVKIGLVPFALAVNVGTGVYTQHPTWFDTAAPTALNTEQIRAAGGYTNVLQAFTALKVNWKGCVRARLGGNDLTDAAPGAGSNTQFTPYFAPDEPTGYSNNYLSGSNEKYHDYNFYANNPTPTAPAPSGSGPNSGCPDAKIQPLTNVKATITGAINTMGHNGGTVVPEGLAWGWRVVSPDAPFTEGAGYDDHTTIKAIILMTDGINDVGGGSNPTYGSIYNAYGYADNGHIGQTNGSNAELTLNSYTTTLCGRIKAAKGTNGADPGIVIYTVGFGIDDCIDHGQYAAELCKRAVELFQRADHRRIAQRLPEHCRRSQPASPGAVSGMRFRAAAFQLDSEAPLSAFVCASGLSENRRPLFDPMR